MYTIYCYLLESFRKTERTSTTNTVNTNGRKSATQPLLEAQERNKKGINESFYIQSELNG